MFNQKNKNIVHLFYIILCLFSGLIFYYIIDPCIPKDILILKFFKSPVSSIPTVFGLLFWLFNKWLWKWWSWFGLINFPNLNGKWEGILKSSYDNFKNKLSATLIIKQTATNIKIQGEFNQSESSSSSAHFDWNEFDNRIVLYYFYQNKPNNNQEKLHQHDGAMKLVYNKDKKKLLGNYLNGKDRNTYGEIELEKQ